MSIYLDLTREFNAGRVRAIVACQAVVLHRLAVMSKDGDWILREDEESLAHLLEVLDRRAARYRFGAPLDVRWLSGGWSAHLQFVERKLRVRTDFFTRPPRLEPERLTQIWSEAAGDVPFVGLRDLAELKKTDRERDWPIIGELARRMSDPRHQLLYSRSARDLQELGRRHPELVTEQIPLRPLLAHIAEGEARLEVELDAERRSHMHANEARLERYARAASAWAAAWPQVEREIQGLALLRAHAVVVGHALELLPLEPAEGRR